MKKYLSSLIAVVSIFLLAIGLFLYLNYLRPKGQLEEEPSSRPDTTGQVDISETKRGEPAKAPFKEAVLNKIWVEDFRTSRLKVGDGETEGVELTIGFEDAGFERKLTIPLMGEVYYGEQVLSGGEAAYEDRGLTPISEIAFEKGNIVTLSIAYIPQGGKADDFTKYCGQNQYPVCKIHPPLGFGQNPIDFEEYFKQVYEVQGTMDLSLVAVTSVVTSPVKVK